MIIGAPARALLATAGVAASVLLVGCGSAGPSQAAVASTTSSTTTSASSAARPDASGSGLVAPVGFRAVTVTITGPDGSPQQHCVWLADDEASQERGLMDVTDPSLGGLGGMVFSFASDTKVGFWMKNTPLPLSIAWFDAQGGFVSSADMPPCPVGTQSCPSYSAASPYRTAIEAPLGRLQSLGLVAGSRLVVGDECDQSAPAASPGS